MPGVNGCRRADLPLTVLHSYWNAAALVEGIPQGLAAETQLEEQRLLLAESVAGLAEKFPEVRVRTELAHGAHHGGPLSRLTRGSVAASVVEHSPCTVATVPTRS